MKKTLSLLAFSALFLACQKEEEASPVGAVAVAGTEKAFSRTFHDDFGVPSCTSPPQNCIHPVVIYPKFRAVITGVLNTVQRGVDADIRGQFAANRTDLIVYLSTAHVDGVIAGSLLARTTAQPDVDGNRYMIIRKADAAGTIETVYPLDL